MAGLTGSVFPQYAVRPQNIEGGKNGDIVWFRGLIRSESNEFVIPDKFIYSRRRESRK